MKAWWRWFVERMNEPFLSPWGGYGQIEAEAAARRNQGLAHRALEARNGITRSEQRQAWFDMTGEDLPHLDHPAPADASHEELARLRTYFDQTEAMRHSVLAWMAGKPTKDGWLCPHGWRELREALTHRREMT